jgi:methylated-DNA-[protein]-cysteine S-methyltransferase
MSNTGKFQLVVDSPIGPLGINASRERINRVEFLDRRSRPFVSNDPFALEVARQLDGYFKESSLEFSLPFDLRGTGFQIRVWQLLIMIKPGDVRSYGDIATELHTSPRAVGNACRSNPAPIIIPCHRVVSANGIGGFAGTTYGRHIDVKRWLLKHEGISL